MGLKVRLEWFDKTTEYACGTEDSKDLGEDYSVVTKLGLSKGEAVNNGMFEPVSYTHLTLPTSDLV